MKIAHLVPLVAFLTGCYLEPPNPRIHVEPPSVNGSTPFGAGKMLVGSNLMSDFIITTFPEGIVVASGKSPPQDPGHLTNCITLPTGSYRLAFKELPGYEKIPISEPINLMVGGTITAYVYFNELGP